MTDSYNQTGQADSTLENLFKAASRSEATLVDENFTKVVLNRLPAQEVREQRQWLPDFFGTMVALLAVWWMLEPAKLMQNIAAAIPQSLTISVTNMLVVAMTLFAAAMIGWWIVERDG